MTSLPRSTAVAESVDPAALARFFDAIGSYGGVHSAMVLRHGSVIGEQWWQPGAPDSPHVMWSVSKSFTSTAVGLAIADGHFTVDSLVVDLLDDLLPETISPHLARLAVRHLLTMTTGHASESLPEDERKPTVDWAREVLAAPLEFEPGTRFVYNSGASYLLSVIVQRATGSSLLDYLTPRLFEPLTIESPSWAASPQDFNVGGWGLSIRTEDLAKFGQLYLQGGEWHGAQLVPAEWVADATSRQVSNGDPVTPDDWAQGYGYQFWQCRNGAFRGDGKDGQFCVVLPEKDVVVALTAKLDDMHGELDVVWEHLLPGLQ